MSAVTEQERTSAAFEFPKLRWHPWLIVLATALPLVELGILQAFGLFEIFPIAPHITAIPALGVFHDLRWIFAWHAGWGTFAAAVVGAVAFRAALMATFVLAAWPHHLPRPSFGVAFRRAAAFTVGALLVLSPFAALLFGAAGISLSWLWFAAVPSAILIASVIHRGAVAGSWWRLPTWRSFGWTWFAFVMLSLTSAAVVAAAEFVGPWLAYLAAAPAGLFNAWSWIGIVRSAAISEFDRPVPPLAPVIAAVVVLGVVFGAASLLGGGRGQVRPDPPATEAEAGDQPVLIVQGFSSAWRGGPVDFLPPPFQDAIYSYDGLGPDGEPLPYGPEATDQSLFHLARLMADQVRALNTETGQPVSIVASSEGALVTQLYLAAVPDAPVDEVVLTSPLVHTAQIYYPPQGDNGWGVASGWELRGVIQAARLAGLEIITADSPLVRSIVDNAPIMRRLTMCDMGPEETAVIPMTVASVAPFDLDARIPTRWLWSTHGSVLGSAQERDVVFRALNGDNLGDGPWFVAKVARALGSGWRMPTVDLDMVAAWRVAGAEVTSTEALDCATVRELARQRLLSAAG